MAGWRRPPAGGSGPDHRREERPLIVRRGIGVSLALAAVVAIVALIGARPGGPPASIGAGSTEVRVLMGAPATIDPAAAGDAGSSRVIAQLFESLTAVDADLVVQPALARSWDVLDGGRRIVFHLRDGLAFSDGTPLTGADVVRSWLRLVDPAHPSPLVSLMLAVKGAAEYARGELTDPSGVGLHASGNDVEVDLIHPAADFASIVAGPSFAIVPAGVTDWTATGAAGAGFVASGAYTLATATATELTLKSNSRYWAGPPAIATVHLAGDLGGRNVVDAYSAGDLDYAELPASDAAWIRYDSTLGPDLRKETQPALEYLGFNTTHAPFDDVRVRQAFAEAIDWARIVTLADPEAEVATGLVPPGIPDRSSSNYLPRHDPAAARALLAQAGFPDGRGFPDVTFASSGDGYPGAVLDQVQRELHVTIHYEILDFDDLSTRLKADAPAIWSLGWVADYPGANDFLGVLLSTGAENNYSRWSSPEFDAAINDALSAPDAASAAAAYDRAQVVVQRDVPVVPLSYGDGWALARSRLLGAQPGPLAIPRLAGLAWR